MLPYEMLAAEVNHEFDHKRTAIALAEKNKASKNFFTIRVCSLVSATKARLDLLVTLTHEG